MKKITNRCTYEEKDEIFHLYISPPIDEKATSQIKLWLILFSIVGLSMIIGAPFIVTNKSEFSFVMIYLAFWTYFEYKVWSAYLYRTNGREYIKFENEKMYYVKEKKGRGLTKGFYVDSMSKWRYESKSSEGFSGMINQAPWMIAGESIVFSDKQGSFSIGIQLDKIEADKIVSFINKKVLKK
jgi:hypothetical protein